MDNWSRRRSASNGAITEIIVAECTQTMSDMTGSLLRAAQGAHTAATSLVLRVEGPLRG